MRTKSDNPVLYSVRISLGSAGRMRTEAQLRSEIDEALASAVDQLKKSPKHRGIGARIEPEGGFLGLGAEWMWLFVAAEEIAVGAGRNFASGMMKKLGEKSGEALFDLFAKELRKRNITLGKTAPVTRSSNKPRNASRGSRGKSKRKKA
jgi:hypothetical protein